MLCVCLCLCVFVALSYHNHCVCCFSSCCCWYIYISVSVSFFLIHCFGCVSIVLLLSYLICADCRACVLSSAWLSRPTTSFLPRASKLLLLGGGGCSLGMEGISRRDAAVRNTSCRLLWRRCRLALAARRSYSTRCAHVDTRTGSSTCSGIRSWSVVASYDRLHDQLVFNLAQV